MLDLAAARFAKNIALLFGKSNGQVRNASVYNLEASSCS